MIGNFQIKVLNDPQAQDILIIRTFSHNCTRECSESAKDILASEGIVDYSIICYVMANYSNGVEVARGVESNFTLLSPFQDALNGFNCTGINHC